MGMKRIIIGIIFCLIVNIYAIDKTPKHYSPEKLNTSAKIDGILNDDVWINAETLTDFIQFYPTNGVEPKFQTEVKIYYTNKSIFIAAQLFDPNPDSIGIELGARDSQTDPNADLFCVHICPYNDGVNSNEFIVSASGVQSDISFALSHEDDNWDAIWKSSVKINDKGWAAEMEIPYSALRFPVKDNQTWGINFYRNIKRFNQWSTWSWLDINNDVFWTNPGHLENLKDIDPPLRLSFIPYVSTYLENNTDGDWGTIYNGGLDLKYGINESFTLDITLIPDFKQTQSDNIVLNLSPFEMAYDEKRQFFIEGMELFNKGDIFYSRRVGGKPRDYYKADDNLGDNEYIKENRDKAALINSTKFSGRTKRGLGIGIFNGITDEMFATVKDSVTGEKRKIKTQPYTNYNMVVLDQTLRNNSYISFANTNMFQNDYISDVFATEFKIKDKNNTYGLEGYAAFSNQFFEDSTARGQRYVVEAGKIKGEFQYEYEISIETDTFNPNDMGYLHNNNEIEQYIQFERVINEPTKLFLQHNYSIMFRYSEIYNPKKFVNFRMDQSFYATFKNHSEYRYHWAIQPQSQHDYFEARTEGRVFKKPTLYHFCNRFNTSSNNRFYYSAFFGINYWKSDFHTYPSFGFNFEPRYRINNKASIAYEFYWWLDDGEQGYVNNDDDDIIFGQRVQKEMTHTIAAKYTINNKTNIDFRLRHYFSNADYDKYFRLKNSGYLEEIDTYTENANINYNAFNIDLVYSWNFAPGSFLNLVWKNSIYEDGERIYERWYDNFDRTISAPQTNSFSLKLLYYFDYGEFK